MPPSAGIPVEQALAIAAQQSPSTGSWWKTAVAALLLFGSAGLAAHLALGGQGRLPPLRISLRLPTWKATRSSSAPSPPKVEVPLVGTDPHTEVSQPTLTPATPEALVLETTATSDASHRPDIPFASPPAADDVPETAMTATPIRHEQIEAPTATAAVATEFAPQVAGPLEAAPVEQEIVAEDAVELVSGAVESGPVLPNFEVHEETEPAKPETDDPALADQSLEEPAGLTAPEEATDVDRQPTPQVEPVETPLAELSPRLAARPLAARPIDPSEGTFVAADLEAAAREALLATTCDRCRANWASSPEQLTETSAVGSPVFCRACQGQSAAGVAPETFAVYCRLAEVATWVTLDNPNELAAVRQQVAAAVGRLTSSQGKLNSIGRQASLRLRNATAHDNGVVLAGTVLEQGHAEDYYWIKLVLFGTPKVVTVTSSEPARLKRHDRVVVLGTVMDSQEPPLPASTVERTPLVRGGYRLPLPARMGPARLGAESRLSRAASAGTSRR